MSIRPSPMSNLPNHLSDATMAAAMDLLPEPIVITAVGGATDSAIDGTVVYCNRAAKDLFQGSGNLQPSADLLEVSMQTRLQAADWTQILYKMRSGQCDLEAQLNLSDQVKVVSIALRKVLPDTICEDLDSLDHSSELWLWRIQDLTPRQQQEAAWLERTAILERSSRHMSEFLSNMSHELRTPLTSILGFSSMLKQQIFGELNEKQSVYVRQIHSSGQYLLALINDILDLSKIEAGQLTLEKTDVSVIRLCTEAIESVQQQSQLKQLNVRSDFDPTIDNLWADDVRVRQMVLNLLSNAIKFSSDGGAIDIRTSLTNLTKQQPQLLCIEVQDYGIGIETEKQHLIFKPFQQVDHSIERRRQGTGLGLALTKHLAELHGGTVSFTSEMGVGSCFVLQLPMVSDASEVVESGYGEE
jgi:signal transduction histidine kinase